MARSGLQINSSVLLEEPGIRRIEQGIIFFCFLAVSLFLVWAKYTELDEVSSASGIVVPGQRFFTVQSISGGTVTAVHVQEGAKVRKGT